MLVIDVEKNFMFVLSSVDGFKMVVVAAFMGDNVLEG